ncbi:hypothetical protein RUND412_000358 [Rhizina undulata]
MDAISVEILYEILNYLPEKDLGSMRLVNHYFESAANELCFRTIRICLSQDGLRKLRYISRRPELARCVRHLMYPYKPRKSSQRLMRSYYPLIPDDCLSDTDPRYSDPFCDHGKQPASEHSGAFSEAIKLALSKMHNLREITVNWNGKHLRRFGGDRPERGLTDFNIHRNTPFDIAPAITLAILAEVFKELMTAVSLANSRIDKLSVYPMHRGLFMGDSRVLWHTPFFQNLTSLSVAFCTSGTRKDAEALMEDTDEGKIFRFLSSLPNLRRLLVALQEVGEFLSRPPKSDVLPFRKIFSDNYVWKHLEAFFFGGGPSINPEDLMDFLARHATTLKTFGLYETRLHSGTWREFLDFIKEMPELRLEKLLLVGVMESTSYDISNVWQYRFKVATQRMESYVLRGGSPFPRTAAEEAQLEIDRIFSRDWADSTLSLWRSSDSLEAADQESADSSESVHSSDLESACSSDSQSTYPDFGDTESESTAPLERVTYSSDSELADFSESLDSAHSPESSESSNSAGSYYSAQEMVRAE